MRILDSWNQVLRCKTVRLVKVLWRHQGVEEATWECEDTMRPPILSYLRTKVRDIIYGTRMITSYACDLMCMCV